MKAWFVPPIVVPIGIVFIVMAMATWRLLG